MPVTYFCVVGPNDASIYEYGKLTGTDIISSSSAGALGSAGAGSAAVGGGGSGSVMTAVGGIADTMHLARQFMLYSALDLADEVMWTKSDLYLSKVDRYDDRYYVSAYIAFAPIKLLLMQDQEPHDNVRPFFAEAYELCVRYLMSPFVSATQPIRSREFDERMVAIYTRYF